jgi:ribosome-associated protein
VSGSGDLVLPARRWLPHGLVIPESELDERFSRSSGPGGQSVNTTDSRVELRWDVAASQVLDDRQRARVQEALATRLVDGVLSLVATEQRSQWQNRQAARARLAELLLEALAPPPPPRRPTRPSRGARQRRLDGKKRRGEIKSARRRPDAE